MFNPCFELPKVAKGLGLREKWKGSGFGLRFWGPVAASAVEEVMFSDVSSSPN